MFYPLPYHKFTLVQITSIRNVALFNNLVFQREENVVGKEQDACNQHFYFSTSFYSPLLKAISHHYVVKR